MGRLLEAYRRHIGGTESTLQLYTGFALFFLGAAASLIGIFVILTGQTLIPDDVARNKLGIFLAALGLPFIFSGIQLTLPSRPLVQILVGVGALICIYGLGQFNQAWPNTWADRYSEIIGIYTIGLMILFTTTAMALVVNFVSRHMVLPGHEPEDIFSDPDRKVTVKEILADIERETAKQNLTWGGMSAGQLKSQVVKLKAEFGSDYVISGGSGTKTTELDDEGDDAYRALMKMRGRDLKEQSDSDDTLSAVQALIAMRREQQAERERSWWYRFKRWLVTLFTGGKRRGPEPPRKTTKKGGPADERTVATKAVSPSSRSE